MAEDQQPTMTMEDLADAVRQIGQVVAAHNEFISGATNEKRVKGAMKRAYGSASDEDKRNFKPALDHLVGKNREHFSGHGFDADHADENFDREFQQLAIQAIEQGANPLAVVMAAAKQHGYTPQEAEAVAEEAAQEAVAQKQDEAGQEQVAAEGEPQMAKEDMAQDMEGDGGAIEAAQAAQRPQGSGVSVKKGYDDYTNEEIDEMARRDPAKYAALISSK